MHTVRIAFRNVARQRRRSVPLAAAVAFGFFVFTVVNAFTAGLLNSVEANVANLTGGHLYVTGAEIGPRGREVSVVRDASVLEAAIVDLGPAVVSYQSRTSTRPTLIAGASHTSQLVVGVGDEDLAATLRSLTFVEGGATAFLANDGGLLLPVATIERLGVEVGERIVVKATTIHGQLNIADFVVTGSIAGQETFGFDFAYAHLQTLDALLDLAPGQVQAISIYLEDLNSLETTADRLYQALAASATTVRVGTAANEAPALRLLMGGGLPTLAAKEPWEGTRYEITTVEEIMGGIHDLVDVMNAISIAIFLVILAIILVGITNAYRMVMIERTPEIGALRAMGVHRAGIRDIFLAEAFLIAVGGAVTGLLVAFAAMGAVGLIDLSASDLGFFLDRGHVRFTIAATDAALYALLICLMSVAAVLAPARAAARIEPAEALRSYA